MTRKHLFIFAAAGMLLASCTDDISPNGPEEPKTDGASFVNFSLNLPSTTAGGRAKEFDDGLPSEYAVANAWLITFIGDENGTEGDATVYEKVELKNLKPWNPVGTESDQVTTEANIVAELKQDYSTTKLDGKKIYALILLNSTETMRDQFVEPTSSATEGTKFSACLKFTDTYDATGNASPMTFKGTDNVLYYTMSNAPLAVTATSDPKLSAETLVEIPHANIKKTAAEAATATPLDIYVERGVAKLTVSQNSFQGTVKNPTMIGETAGSEVTVTLTDWAFDMGNKSSKILHDVTGFMGTDAWGELTNKENEHRFYGTNLVFADHFRIYWAIDTNYNTYNENDFNKISGSTQWHSFSSTADEAEYPLENTFDVANMDQDETSRVVVKATIAPTTTGGATAAETAPSTLYRVGSSTTLYDYAALKKLVAEVAKTATGKDFSMVDAEPTTWTLSDGKYTLEAADFATTQPTTDELGAINNALGDIVFFKDGVCYYKILVKHFGDADTPWEGGDYEDAGNDTNKRYLGRYGMVRNNWYDLSISSAKTIGTPEIPDALDIQDDEMSSYLNVTCKILSWAKRSQNVTL